MSGPKIRGGPSTPSRFGLNFLGSASATQDHCSATVQKMVKTGILLRRITGLVLLSLTLATGAGCTMPGAPQTLDEEQLGVISERVTQSQPGLEAALRADTKSC